MIKGFKMKLYEGQEEEYERRHNLLWPEMKDMIHEHGGKNYTIFLDKETLTLFGYIEIEDEELWAKGADTAINRKWWDYMADIMETNPDNSPVSIDLKNVFHLCRQAIISFSRECASTAERLFLYDREQSFLSYKKRTVRTLAKEGSVNRRRDRYASKQAYQSHFSVCRQVNVLSADKFYQRMERTSMISWK